MEQNSQKNDLKQLRVESSSSPILITTLTPDSCPFVTGIAPSYSGEYNEDTLGQYIDLQTFNNSIERINASLFTYWPCPLCYYGCGLMFGLVTCGLTCLLPYTCIRDAKIELENVIEQLNKKVYHPKGLSLKFNERCFYRSDIEILLIRDIASAETEDGKIHHKKHKLELKDFQMNNETEDDNSI